VSKGSQNDPVDVAASLPQPGTPGAGPPGFLPGTLVFGVAAAAVTVSGSVLFGWYSIRVIAISVAVALLAEFALNAIRRRSAAGSNGRALLVGMLFACTLPPTVSWQVVLTGSLLAILVGQTMSGGTGNYIWHPVAIGRVAVQILFFNEMTPDRLPVLGPGRLLWGNLEHAQRLPPLATWASCPLPPGVEAWLVQPVDSLLRANLVGRSGDPASGLLAFIRDAAPPWRDTLTGVAGGAIGEACGVVILVAACLLIWRGFLRWPMLVAGLATAALAAAILPVPTGDAAGRSLTLPGLVTSDGLPVGFAYVMYHLTAGGFLFVLLLLAPAPSSSPLTRRGHAWFGGIIGALTIILRVVVGLPAAAYWALLAANTLVPVINRLTRRRVFGT
jgi:Na+-translocating ferredoxin:NAD+ oxidoreductase subunit D